VLRNSPDSLRPDLFHCHGAEVVRDIERIGDIVNIAERAAELIQEPEMKRLIDAIMAEAAQRIRKESLTLVIPMRNGGVIGTTGSSTIAMSRSFASCSPHDGGQTISRALKVIFIAKHLERVGDHSANIAEMVIFLVRGQDIRHGTRLDRG
jgi:phosphate transport system protein